MAHSTMINFRMDKDLKQEMEKVCKEMGLSMTTAFTIFATRVSKEKRIPFEVTAEPYLEPANQQYVLDALDEAEKEAADPNVKWYSHEEVKVNFLNRKKKTNV